MDRRFAQPRASPTLPDDPKETTIDTDVLVVGAGPVGLALAVELGLQGVRCLLIERADRSGLSPRAKTTNVRSRELMRRWGIADRLAAASPFGVDYPSNVVFATRLGGHRLARFENAFACRTERDDRFAEHAQWIPQYKVEAVLRGRALEAPGTVMRTGVSLEDWTEVDGGIEARLTDVETGRTEHVRARWLVGADGARSTVRERLGIRMEGESLSRHRNTIFRSPGLAERHPQGPAVMYWLVNNQVPSVLAPLDVGDTWTFSCPREIAADDEAPLIRAAIGLPDTPIEVISHDEWTAHRLIAGRYRSGRVFLVGDACHLHPPFGGYGMNMGIGDAVDLGWKLAATLRGWGGPALLDSYEVERRQVHRRVVDEAVANLGHSTSALTTEGIEDDGPAGDALRAEVGRRILATKRREFHSLGVVIGTRYTRSPVLAIEPDAPPPPEDASVYTPTATPGARAPHAWLTEGTGPGASLYDAFATDGFSLLVTRPAARAAAAGFEAAAAAAGLPLRTVAPDAPALRELYQADLVLVRPDQHVAWRGGQAADAAAILDRVTGRGSLA
ncbi:MAG: FAD-dependent monooxygenase [Burkholderiaceae bacterium]